MFSILCPEPVQWQTREPDCFRDLNLDRLMGPIAEGEKRIALAPIFYTPLQTEDQAKYRQEILKDLGRGENFRLLDDFSGEICSLADREAQALQDLESGDPWRCHDLLRGHILDYGERYVACICSLRRALPGMELASRGLRQAAENLEALCVSSFFRDLSCAQRDLRQKFDGLQYVMQVKYGTIRVKKYQGEEDLSQKILSVFQKFRQETGRDYRQQLREEPYADHVEAAVLQCLSRLYPREFEELSAYVRRFARFTDPELLQFCREIRFYIDWLAVIRPMESWGLPFCFPDFSEGRVWAEGLFDPVLASRVGSVVVKNGFRLEPGEQILVITGPNQGGKTTYARALGQLHYLASLGLCVPGTGAQLRLTDQVLTHFEREESAGSGSGKLQDDLQRLQNLLSRATEKSFLVINEIFASTSAQDAAVLGKRMTEKILAAGSGAVVVTFLSELAEASPGIVSMMSTVDPENPEQRTFRIIRKPPDEMTYAMTLARKHRLTREQIIRRIGL